MTRTIKVIVAVVGMAVLLSACFVLEPSPRPTPTPDVTMPAGTDSANPSPQSLGTLANNQSVLVRINLPPQAANFDMLHVELNRNVELQLLDRDQAAELNRGQLAISRSRTHFARNVADLATVASIAVDSQAIVPQPACIGSCIQWVPGQVQAYYARVTNRSGASVDVEIFALLQDFADQGEALGNNTPVNAISLGTGASGTSANDEGAIEVLGDVDYWRITGVGNLTFDAIGGAGVQAQRVNADGSAVGEPIMDGQTVGVSTNQLIRVWSPVGRAGNADGSASLYFLSVQY